MKLGSIFHRFLAALALVAFLSQTVSVTIAHDHQSQQNNHNTADAVSMQHMHHAMDLASTDSNKKPNNATTNDDDCCQQQCECDIAHCSLLYALAPGGLEFVSDAVTQQLHANITLEFALPSSLFRPPITQYV